VADTPKRVRRERTKGFRLPEGAVCVDRTTKWGNPFKVGEKIRNDSPLWPYIAATVPGGARGLAALDTDPGHEPASPRHTRAEEEK
jgi:hypothetical protein